MKKYYLSSIVLMMVLAFVSCNNDDDDNPAVDKRLVGTWYSTTSEVWEYKNDVLVTHCKYIDDGKSMRVYEIIDGKDTGEYHDYINHEVWWDEVTFNSNGVVTVNNSSEEPYGGTFVTSDGVMTITDSSNGKVYHIPYEIKDGILIFTADQRKVYRDQGYSYLTITHYHKGSYPYK